MSFLPRRAIGALLAAATAVTTVTVSPQHACSESPPAETDAAPGDGGATPTTFISASEAAHARALLDRYYALSADATSANRSEPQVQSSPHAPAPPPPNKEKPAFSRHRVPAHQVFADVDTSKLSGSFCKRYVICGGGTAAWAAIDAIIRTNPKAASDILLISNEPFLPYNRTLLSKELWHPNHTEKIHSSSALESTVEYAYRHADGETRVSVMRDTRAVRLDVDEKSVELSNGTVVHYDKLLLATGGNPRRPSVISSALADPAIASSVSVFRKITDFTRLHAIVSKSKDTGVIVIGGGFSGAELAVSLASISNAVSLVIGEAGVLYRVLPRYLCEFISRKIESLGVKVVRSAVVTGARRKGGEDDKDGDVVLQLVSPDAEEVSGKEVVVSVGIDPEVSLGQDAGLEVDGNNGGLTVNDFMMAEPDVYVAGDAASFHDRTLGRRRVEHWDHAVVTGRIAGENMAGKRSRYGLQSMFWCDLSNIDVNITAVGLIDSKLETVGVWNTALPCIEDVPSANELLSGVVYYLKGSEIVGVVLWNPRKGSGALRRARAVVDAKTDSSGLSDRMLGDLVNLDDGSFRMCVRTKSVKL